MHILIRSPYTPYSIYSRGTKGVLGFEAEVYGLGFRIQGSGSRVLGIGALGFKRRFWELLSCSFDLNSTVILR